MVFIETALTIEAAPIIEYFKLKRDMTIHAYQVYKNSDIALIVSGTGKVKSAMAAVYLLSVYNSSRKDIFINIGFCGISNTEYELGSIILIDKITDMDTGWDYYPDVYTGYELPHKALCCYSRPVKEGSIKGKNVCCDMESAGIMEAGKKLIYAHNVVVLKIISDYLAPEALNREVLQGYIRENMTHIDNMISQLKQLNSSFTELSMEEEGKLLDPISENLKFSESMRQMLLKEVRRAKLKGLKPSDILNIYTDVKVDSKMEGKKILEQIIKRLKQKSI